MHSGIWNVYSTRSGRSQYLLDYQRSAIFKLAQGLKEVAIEPEFNPSGRALPSQRQSEVMTAVIE